MFIGAHTKCHEKLFFWIEFKQKSIKLQFFMLGLKQLEDDAVDGWSEQLTNLNLRNKRSFQVTVVPRWFKIRSGIMSRTLAGFLNMFISVPIFVVYGINRFLWA